MGEEFRQPDEFNMASEFSQQDSASEYHMPLGEYAALSQEYYAPSREFDELKGQALSGQYESPKPSKASAFKKVKKMLYVASATVFVTVATQAVYPDFVVFSDPFPAEQEWEASAELPSQETAALSPSAEDGPSKPADPSAPSAGNLESEEPVESEEASASQESSVQWVDCPNCEGGLVVCPVCNGDWEHGSTETVEIDCEHCENGTHQKSQTIYVYNGTPCKACNDVGTFVNVNGETEECGECRGYASRHQVGEKQIFEYYNEFYRVYAFDESVEYVEEDCPVCGGRGVISEEIEVPCTECNEGWLECPVCQGEAGYYE